MAYLFYLLENGVSYKKIYMIKKIPLHSSQGFDQIGPIKNKNQTQLKFLVEIIYQLIDTYFFSAISNISDAGFSPAQSLPVSEISFR